MKQNVGSLDRIIRVVLAVILIALSLMHVLTGTLGIIAIVIGGVLVLTSVVSFCPLYALGKLSTKKG